jgi:hypothetical protein
MLLAAVTAYAAAFAWRLRMLAYTSERERPVNASTRANALRFLYLIPDPEDSIERSEPGLGRGKGDRDQRQPYLRYQSQAVGLLLEGLADPERVPSDECLQTSLMLLRLAFLVKDEDAVGTHTEGVRRMWGMRRVMEGREDRWDGGRGRSRKGNGRREEMEDEDGEEVLRTDLNLGSIDLVKAYLRGSDGGKRR